MGAKPHPSQLPVESPARVFLPEQDHQKRRHIQACTETESWYILEDPGAATWNIDSRGISTCDPEGCQFAVADGPCEVGARDNDTEVQVDDTMEGVLDFTFLATYAAPSCDGALRLKFERQ